MTKEKHGSGCAQDSPIQLAAPRDCPLFRSAASRTHLTALRPSCPVTCLAHLAGTRGLGRTLAHAGPPGTAARLFLLQPEHGKQPPVNNLGSGGRRATVAVLTCIRGSPGGVSMIRHRVLCSARILWNPGSFESSPSVDWEVQCSKLVLTTRA